MRAHSAFLCSVLTTVVTWILPEPGQAMREYVALRLTQPHFANARSMRNALDRARLRQASRLVAAPGLAVDRDALMTIEAADIRASRVFGAPPARDPAEEATC